MLASIPLASLTLGAQVYYAELPQGISMRYAQLKYTVVGTDPTTGKITAGIVDGVQSNGTP